MDLSHHLQFARAKSTGWPRLGAHRLGYGEVRPCSGVVCQLAVSSRSTEAEGVALAPTLLAAKVMESRKFHDDNVMGADQAGSPAGGDGVDTSTPADPRISVVILASGSVGDLTVMLDSVVPLRRAHAIRVFVISDSEALEQEFGIGNPDVRFLMVGAGLTDGERRAAGLRAAGGDVVIFLRDRGLRGDAWRSAILRGWDLPGGPIDEPSAAWAASLTRRGIPGALGDS